MQIYLLYSAKGLKKKNKKTLFVAPVTQGKEPLLYIRKLIDTNQRTQKGRT